MDSQLTPPVMHNVHYDVPRFIVGEPGSQNRSPNGDMKIIAGTSQPFDFKFMTKDGVALNLTPFDAYLLFWQANRFDMNESTGGHDLSNINDITLRKKLDIIKPYEGRATTLISSIETDKIGHDSKNNSVRWGLFLVNSDKEVFAMTVTDSGNVYGSVIVETGTIPPYEVIVG